MEIKLRNYQREAINSIVRYFNNVKGNPCVVLPTGSGKSIVMAKFIQECLEKWPTLRFCVVAHVKELVKQNAEKLQTIWPEADIGIYAAGLKRRDKDNQIIFASIQSVYNKTMTEVGSFDVVLVDEAHRIPISGEGQYRRFLKDQSKLTKGFKVAGFTATPYRLNGGAICHDENILSKICYDAPVKEMIDDGYLCRPKSLDDRLDVDLSSIKTTGGDFNLQELDIKMSALNIVDKTVKEIIKYTEERNRTIIFCVSVKHAELISAEIMEHGHACPLVTGDTPHNERKQIVEDFNNGVYKYLANCAVFTEGFDSPGVDCVAIARPTKSAGLYMQMCGRGLRVHDSKDDCLILDFGRNIERHGPIDAILPPKRKTKRAINQVVEYEYKFCPVCDEEGLNRLALNVRACPQCGHEFNIERGSEIDQEASNLSILSGPVKVEKKEWHFVDSCTYHFHAKPEGTDSLRVDYHCGLRVFREWVCINHEGYAKQKADKWIRDRVGDFGYENFYYVVKDIEDDQERIWKHIDLGKKGYFKEPDQILVDETGKYPSIVQYMFPKKTQEDLDWMENEENHESTNIN